jgi:predicted Holliday junction resolvase-like endonuclease
MKYAKYIKELFFIILFVSLSVTTVDNIRTIRQLRINIEQTKNNLYQTNQVIAEMQKQIYESNLVVNQTSN